MIALERESPKIKIHGKVLHYVGLLVLVTASRRELRYWGSILRGLGVSLSVANIINDYQLQQWFITQQVSAPTNSTELTEVGSACEQSHLF